MKDSVGVMVNIEGNKGVAIAVTKRMRRIGMQINLDLHHPCVLM